GRSVLRPAGSSRRPSAAVWSGAVWVPQSTPAVATAVWTLKGSVVVKVRPLLVTWSVYPTPTVSSVNPVNVATPPWAVTPSVPPSVAPPGLFSSATATLPAKFGSTLRNSSSAETTRPNPLPTVTPLGGWAVTINWLAVAAFTSKELVVAEAR